MSSLEVRILILRLQHLKVILQRACCQLATSIELSVVVTSQSNWAQAVLITHQLRNDLQSSVQYLLTEVQICNEELVRLTNLEQNV